MKLTSTDRPFGLTIKFTWHHETLLPPQNLAAQRVTPCALEKQGQRAELDGAPAYKFCDSFRKNSMLFSCEIIRRKAVVSGCSPVASLTKASGWSTASAVQSDSTP